MCHRPAGPRVVDTTLLPDTTTYRPYHHTRNHPTGTGPATDMPECYEVTDEEGGLVMVAPLPMLARIFHLHASALARIYASPEGCEVHFNGASYAGCDSIYTRRLTAVNYTVDK